MVILNILLWLLIGALAGWLAGIIMRSRGSLIRNIILGIAGALLGGWIVSFFADVTKFSIIGFLVAVGGAVSSFSFSGFCLAAKEGKLPVKFANDQSVWCCNHIVFVKLAVRYCFTALITQLRTWRLSCNAGLAEGVYLLETESAGK